MNTDVHGLNQRTGEALVLGPRRDSRSTDTDFFVDGDASLKTQRRFPFFIRVNLCSSLDQIRLESHHAS